VESAVSVDDSPMSANERLAVGPWLPGHDRLDERGAASSAPLKVTSAMVQERVLEWDLKWHGQVDEVHKTTARLILHLLSLLHSRHSP